MPRPHGASARVFHKCLSFAFFSALAQVSPLLLNILSVVLLHVSFGLPLLLFPCGVHLSAIFGSELSVIRITCPNHHQRLSSIIVVSGFICISANKMVFLMVFGQNIFLILRKHLVWKEFNLFSMVLVIFQHSLP